MASKVATVASKVIGAASKSSGAVASGATSMGSMAKAAMAADTAGAAPTTKAVTAAAAAAALLLSGATSFADDYDSDLPKDERAPGAMQTDKLPKPPVSQDGEIPGSMQDERSTTSARDGDVEVDAAEATGRDESLDDDAEATDTKKDQAPVAIPGSTSPGAEMDDTGELEATGTPGQHGADRDATGGYDAKGPIQMDGDVEASTGDLTGDIADYESPLHQRNLQEAMDPNNARYKSRGDHEG